jgi:hypothetical protein
MDDILMMAVMLVLIRIVAVVVARYVKFEGPIGWPLGSESREGFWRRALPWPHGVQEDDEIAWHVPRTVAPVSPAAERLARVASPGGRPVPPTRPQSRIVGR